VPDLDQFTIAPTISAADLGGQGVRRVNGRRAQNMFNGMKPMACKT
jgi:hypothetical protein